MPTFDVEPEEIYIFAVGEEYLFSQYFDRTDVFEALREYYDDETYRFEVSADEFDDVQQVLEDEHFEPIVVGDLDPFCVLKKKYSDHAETLWNSVATWERDSQMCFLMQDDRSVRTALERGARRFAETNYVVGL